MTTQRPAATRTSLVRLLAGGALLAIAGQAVAEDTELTQQPFQISLGTFTNNTKLTIRADGQTTGDGTTFDWGRTFGDVDGTRGRLDAYWRINDRHHVRLMYTNNSNTNRRVLDRDIEWQGETIPVSATVEAELGFDVIEVAYEYDFSKRVDRELVLSAGLHYTTFNASLTGTYSTPGGGGGTTTVGGDADLDAPLPVIGARGMWNIGDSNWWLDAQVQFFALSFDGIDGSIANYRAAVIWQPKQWFGIGAGFDSFGIDVDVEGDNNRISGSLDWTYSGPQLFFNFAF